MRLAESLEGVGLTGDETSVSRLARDNNVGLTAAFVDGLVVSAPRPVDEVSVNGFEVGDGVEGDLATGKFGNIHSIKRQKQA